MTVVRVSGILVWLTLLWVMLWGNVSAANVLSGIAVAIGILAFSRLPRVTRVAKDHAVRLSPIGIVRFGFFVFAQLVVSSVRLAWEIVTPRNSINTGVVAVPLRSESEFVMMVVANVITLTPGTITIEVEGSPPVLYVNVLHLHDVDEVRRDLLHIEAVAIRAFGSSAARADLAESGSM